MLLECIWNGETGKRTLKLRGMMMVMVVVRMRVRVWVWVSLVVMEGKLWL